MPVETDDVIEHLSRDGYYVGRVPAAAEDAARLVLDVGRSLGDLYVPQDCDPTEPIIRTKPTRAGRAAPFDRPEAIGWHGDFATSEERPELSVVYVTRPDPRGAEFGAWRLASVTRVIGALRATAEGRATVDLLGAEPLPFRYAEGGASRWFRALERRPEGTIGLRFYQPSIRRGCITEYGDVPSRVTVALDALERAADAVADVVPTREGSLLIASNWFALHDRSRQTISRNHQNREALLCFVARQRLGVGNPHP